MFLHSLHLTNFKNYENAVLEFSEKVNCIVGLNGMGKTNLLDAVYYLCMCKSRFASSDKLVVRQTNDEKAEFFRLEGAFIKNGEKEKVVAKIKPGSVKEFERNGSVYERLLDHIGLFPVIFVAPDDANLLLEGSESRRLLMDNLLSQLSQEYLLNLVTYNRLLQQRNAALKQFAEKGGYNAALIRAYNNQMVLPGNVLHLHRKRFLEQFNPLLAAFYKIISGNREQVAASYVSELTERSFDVLLEEAMEKDRVMARSTSGIHKDDLTFELSGFPLKRFASQGQLKSFLIAVKLAQYEILRLDKGTTPILLLDDIFDKLDDLRVSSLLELLHSENFGQIFLSDTHESRAAEIIRSFSNNFRKFVITDGEVLKC